MLYWTPIGRLEEGLAEWKRAGELDPITPLFNLGPGFTLFYQRNYDRAIEELQQALERKGDSGARVRWYGMKVYPYFPYFKLGIAYYNLGQFEAALQADGIDIEWLLSQRWVVADRRRQAAVATNAALDGQSVEIAGFLILAPPTESGEQTAYLLPDRGICNHLPPPPPNQLVRVLLKDVPENGGCGVPATVRGALRAEEARHEVTVIDHSLPMWSGWMLEADEIRVANRSMPDEPIPH